VTANALTGNHGRELRRRPVRRNGLVQLGWAHFWLLGGILGGMLALAVLIIFALLLSN
jgi:hypothetical protein